MILETLGKAILWANGLRFHREIPIGKMKFSGA
jgi:hypothetical protein